jgi:uncharacterized protein (TIGR00369 family)
MGLSVAQGAPVQEESAPSGVELIRMVQDGRIPPPGVATLLDMRIAEVEDGRVVFELDAKPEFGNPLGTVHGGITATLLDSALGCAVQTSLPAGDSYTTLDLSVTYLRAIPYDGRLLRGEGRIVHVGGRVATAEGSVIDGEERLVATATATCMVFRGATR